jgi:hypothetical protein
MGGGEEAILSQGCQSFAGGLSTEGKFRSGVHPHLRRAPGGDAPVQRGDKVDATYMMTGTEGYPGIDQDDQYIDEIVL